MVNFKRASVAGDRIEWLEESDEEELSGARMSACRQALSGGMVTASNGVRIEVGRQWGAKPEEGDGRLFWLSEPGKGKTRLYLVLDDSMEEAGEEESLVRMIEEGAQGGATSEAGKKTARDLMEARPVLVTKLWGKAGLAKVEEAMREVALGVSRALGEQSKP